jgi:hypothetical protein
MCLGRVQAPTVGIGTLTYSLTMTHTQSHSSISAASIMPVNTKSKRYLIIA